VVSKRKEDSKLGEISDVLIQDCTFENTWPKKSLVQSEGDRIGIKMTIENLMIAGKRINLPEEANIETVQSQIIFRNKN
jgi:hypothetical protein